MKKLFVVVCLIFASSQALAGKRTNLLEMRSKDGVCYYTFDVHEVNSYKNELIARTTCNFNGRRGTARCVADIHPFIEFNSDTKLYFDCNEIGLNKKLSWTSERELRSRMYNMAFVDSEMRP